MSILYIAARFYLLATLAGDRDLIRECVVEAETGLERGSFSPFSSEKIPFQCQNV